MHFQSIAYVIGVLLIVASMAMLPPLAVSIIYQDGDTIALLISIGLIFGVGFPLCWLRPNNQE